MEGNQNTENNSIEPETGGELYVEFHKPYKFEGKEYSGVDLSGLEDLSYSDMVAVDKMVQRRGISSRELLAATPEHIMPYEARAAKLPIEFFKGMSFRDAERVNATVAGFLLM